MSRTLLALCLCLAGALAWTASSPAAAQSSDTPLPPGWELCVLQGVTAPVTPANIADLDEWQAGGKTDLPNMGLLCAYHHHLIHSKLWSVSGNANEELRFTGPEGQVLTSRPSPLWTLITNPRTRPGRRDGKGNDRSGPNSGNRSP